MSYATAITLLGLALVVMACMRRRRTPADGADVTREIEAWRDGV